MVLSIFKYTLNSGPVIDKHTIIDFFLFSIIIDSLQFSSLWYQMTSKFITHSTFTLILKLYQSIKIWHSLTVVLYFDKVTRFCIWSKLSIYGRYSPASSYTCELHKNYFQFKQSKIHFPVKHWKHNLYIR